MPGQVPVALVSGAATVAQIAVDYVDGTEFQIVKLNIGAASADNLFVGGQRDPENSISIVGASGALFNVAASVRGNVAASVAGHVLVSGDGTFGVSIVDVSANVPASVRNTVDVSSRQIDVSAHGVIIASVQGNVAASVAGHVLTSVDGTPNITITGDTTRVSAGATANGNGWLIMGVDGASAARFLLTDTAGRQVVTVSAGQIIASVQGNVAASVAGHVLVSADGHVLASVEGTHPVSGAGTFDVNIVNVSANVPVSVKNTVDVSSRQIDVSAHGVVTAAGRVTTYFAQPASYIVDGANSEQSKIISVSGASAGTYKLVSAAASGVLRISRIMLVVGSAVNLTFRQTSVAASSINFTGPLPLGDRGSIVLDRSDSPWFVTTGTKDFGVNVSAGVGIYGTVWWY